MKKFLQMFPSSLRELKNVRNLVLCGLMAALGIVLRTVATINIGPYIRIGFSDTPNRVVDFLFGPAVGCLFGGMLDIFKYFLTPSSGSFFFGFTLNAMLGGLIYGSLLYRHPVSWKRILIAEVLVKVFVNCILGTLWVSMLYGNAFIALFPMRALKNVIMIPVDTIILYFVLNLVKGIATRLDFYTPTKA